MSFQTASAILRGHWYIDKSWTAAHLPLILRLAKGEPVDFGMKREVGASMAHAGTGTSRPTYTVWPGSKVNSMPDDTIAIVSLTGPVTKYGDLCSYGTADYAALVTRLGQSSNISGIILSVDSPGGQADGTAMLADAIKAASDRKPVLGVIDDGMAASAAMWIVSPAHEIYVTQATDQVGSIGVYTTIADWYAFYEKEGLPVRDVYAPQSTDKNKAYKEALDGKDDLIVEDLRVLADQFINTIASNRAGKLSGRDWATGKLYYAPQAVQLGLIDGIKPFDQVLQRMDELIQSRLSNSNNNTMAFEKTLATAKATEFAVTEGGFLLTEENLNNLEAHIEDQFTVAAAAAEAATATQNQITALQADLQTSQARISELEGDVQAKDARIEELKNGGNVTNTTKQGDSFDTAGASDEFAHNKWADEMLGA